SGRDLLTGPRAPEIGGAVHEQSEVGTQDRVEGRGGNSFLVAREQVSVTSDGDRVLVLRRRRIALPRGGCARDPVTAVVTTGRVVDQGVVERETRRVQAMEPVPRDPRVSPMRRRERS